MAVNDPRSVIVDGVVKAPSMPVALCGTGATVAADGENAVTTVSFADARRKPRTVAFADPIGVDGANVPLRHPLGRMVDTMFANGQFETIALNLDGKGNLDYAVGNAQYLDRGHVGPGAPKMLLPDDRRLAAPIAQPGPHLEELLANRAEVDRELRETIDFQVTLHPMLSKSWLSFEGIIVGYEDRNGVKTLSYESPQGELGQLSFPDPVGRDVSGQPIRNPIAVAVDADFQTYKGADFRLDFKGNGKAAVFEAAGPRDDQPHEVKPIGPEGDAYAQSLAATRPPLATPLPPLGSQPLPKAPDVSIGSLLTPTGPTIEVDGIEYVSLGNPPGSLRVERSLFEEFKTAETYLCRSREAHDALYHLEHPDAASARGGPAPLPVSIRRPRFELDVTENDPDLANPDSANPKGTIVWNPRLAPVTIDGHVQSPALALLHESGHELKLQRGGVDPNRNVRLGADSVHFDDEEERRDILGFETRVARDLGEPVRYTHIMRDNPKTVTSPTSREPVREVAPYHSHVHPGMPTAEAAVRLDGVPQPNGISISGTIAGFDDRDGVKTLTFEDRGQIKRLSYDDPAFDVWGRMQHNPLRELSDDFLAGKGGAFALNIDPSNHNVVGSIGRLPIEMGPQAAEFAQKLSHVSDRANVPAL